MLKLDDVVEPGYVELVGVNYVRISYLEDVSVIYLFLLRQGFFVSCQPPDIPPTTILLPTQGYIPERSAPPKVRPTPTLFHTKSLILCLSRGDLDSFSSSTPVFLLPLIINNDSTKCYYGEGTTTSIIIPTYHIPSQPSKSDPSLLRFC